MTHLRQALQAYVPGIQGRGLEEIRVCPSGLGAKPAAGGAHNSLRRAARQARSQPLAAHNQVRSQPLAVATPEEALTEASEDALSLTSQWTPIGETC